MAGEICSSAGGSLAEVESPEEEDILRQYVDEFVDEFWIGGSKNESTWTWRHNGNSIKLGFSDIDHDSEKVHGVFITIEYIFDQTEG